MSRSPRVAEDYTRIVLEVTRGRDKSLDFSVSSDCLHKSSVESELK